MAPDSVESRLQHLQPIVLHSSSGQLRVLDRAARIVCDVESGGSDDHVVAQLEAVLAESPRSSWNPDVRLYIQLVEGALQLSCLPDALAKLCLFLEPSSYRQITVHSSEPIGDQELVVTALSKTRELLGDSRNVGIEVVGPLKVAPERFLDSLFDAGIRLRVAAGWAPGQEASQCLGVDAVALRAYAEYGFRVAIAWYVHAYNIEALKERIPELLLVNMNRVQLAHLACLAV